MSLVRQYLANRCWAILPEYLELMSAIEARDVEDRDAIVKAIEQRFGKPLSGTRETRIRGDAAIVPVSGPLFRYANLFTEISGATSFEGLALDIGTVMRNEEVRRVIFDINSPGGEVDGMSETAALIRSFRGQKPMTAFISHLGTSAAYGLAAAADRVIGADTSMVGSIGTVLGIRDYRELDKKRGVRTLELVSSQTPLKRVDPFAEDSEKRDKALSVLQKRVDALAQVFIEGVAADRGRSPKAIASLEGAIYVGQQGLEVGLLDGIGTLEALIEGGMAGEVGRRIIIAADSGAHSEESSMADDKKSTDAAPTITRAYLEANHAELVAAFRHEGHAKGREEGLAAGRTDGATAERERILGILSIEAKGHEDMKRACLEDPKVTKGDAALKILQARGQADERQKQKAKDDLEADEKEVQKVATVPASETDEGEADAVAASVLKHARAWQQTGQAE